MNYIDYDLFVIDPENMKSTSWQIRDSIYDALKALDNRIAKLEELEGINQKIKAPSPSNDENGSKEIKNEI